MSDTGDDTKKEAFRATVEVRLSDGTSRLIPLIVEPSTWARFVDGKEDADNVSARATRAAQDFIAIRGALGIPPESIKRMFITDRLPDGARMLGEFDQDLLNELTPEGSDHSETNRWMFCNEDDSCQCSYCVFF